MAANIVLNPGKDYSEAFYFEVKRDGEEIASIIGTCHADEPGRSKLNPLIEEAALKANRIAVESPPFSRAFWRRVEATKRDCYVEYDEYYTREYDSQKTVKYSSPSLGKEIPDLIPENGTEYLIVKACGIDFSKTLSLATLEQTAKTYNYLDKMNSYSWKQIRDQYVSRAELNAVMLDTHIAYRNGDEALVMQYQAWQKLQDPAQIFFLIETRNHGFVERSAPWIRESTSDNRLLIALGFDHLFGDQGFIQLLRKDLGAEYTIERKTSV